MEDRKFSKPVDWLIGRQLLGSIKGILLYTAYGKKLDPRDWMEPHVFPSREKPAGLKFWCEQIKSQEGRVNTDPETEEQFWDKKKEFWFDYMADTGDGMKATYSIAYLILSNLYVDSCGGVKTRDAQTGDKLLPRGQFLFIGGDTAYHTSDYIALANRVQRPFKWAYQDVEKDTGAPGNRPLFGIPGNHDYYDQLDGFRLQFRRPIGEGPTKPCPTTAHIPVIPKLSLPGFTRQQCSSYVALHLPFDWWLWGLDTEVGQIDPRQQKFFCDLSEPTADQRSMVPPSKLILATCAPTTVFGKLADPNDGKAVDAIAQLGLSQPFLPKGNPNGTYNWDSAGDSKMRAGQCRLDISGDVHHYERYWGPKSVKAEDSRQNARAKAPSADSYASVVSGAGGAFHHPSATFVDEVREQALYPSEEQSTDAIAQRIFKFWQILRGGSVHIAGFALAFIITFADFVPNSSRETVRNILSRDAWTALSPIIQHWSAGYDALNAAKIFLFALSPFLLFGAAFSKRLFGVKSKTTSIGAKVKPSKMETTPRGPEVRVQPKDSESTAEPDLRLWIITILSGVTGFWGLFKIDSDAAYLTDLASSILVLFSLTWATGAITLSLRYSEFLFEKCRRDYIKPGDWALTWALSVLSIIAAASGLWRFGNNTVPGHLVSDIVFILAVAGIFSGLLIFPFISGGELLQRKPSVVRWTGKLLIGLWHAILQIAVPFLIVYGGTFLTWLAAVALLIAFAAVGKLFLERRNQIGLILSWLVYGGLMLTLTATTNTAASSLEPSFLGPEWLGRWGLIPAFLAGCVGAVTSCVWFGWYLAVCFVFNGHNNEVGGAAQIEEFKQFIRFCLTENGLTGYVIAVDHPQESEHRDRLCPKIVDVIKLKVKDNSAKQTGSH